MELSEIRKEIDKCDNEIIKYLIKRMDCSGIVADIKREQGLPVYHPIREQEIITKVKASSDKYGAYLAELYRMLMECSREYQNSKLKPSGKIKELISSAHKKLDISGDVACYGAEGSFSHLALIKGFNTAKPVFCAEFSDVFEKVKSGECNYGFVPVENSSAGSVREVYDLILEYKTYIVSAVNMPVKHNLLAITGAKTEDIKTVYSHPQAIMQCKEFLEKNNIKAIKAEDTASAAKMVANLNDTTIASIGSDYSAQKYNLSVLQSSIQSFAKNKTRFIVISGKPIIESGSNIISLVFSTQHTPGALQRILTRFAMHGLNLIKLESRAGHGGDFETQFYLDFEGNAENNDTAALLTALSLELEDFEFLGNYSEEAL